MFKNILYCLHAHGQEDVSVPACTSYVIDMAAHMSAHLSILGIAPKFGQGVAFRVAMVSALIAENDKKLAENAGAMCAAVAGAAQGRGVTASCETVQRQFDQTAARACALARLHDLVVVARPDGENTVMTGLIEGLLFDSGRPVLIVDPDYAKPAALDRIVVAWNGSQPAARAVWESLPLLKAAGAVDIVAVNNAQEMQSLVRGAELAPSLARHGVKVTVTDLPMGRGSVSDALKEHALSVRADILVVGAFGHNRWREFILGGVTQDLLRTAKMPVLLAH